MTSLTDEDTYLDLSTKWQEYWSNHAERFTSIDASLNS